MKNKMNRLVNGLFFGLLVTLFATSCSKDAGIASDTRALSLFITDAPALFDTVNIDIRYAEVKLDTCGGHKRNDHFGDNDAHGDDDRRNHDEFGQWDTLSISPGIYNIAALRNGLDVLLGTATVTGTIRKIRLTLGTNNTVVKNGISAPLLLSPAINNYLYVNVRDEHHERNGNSGDALWLDFDISRSVQLINGNYYLTPVMKPFCNKNFGAVAGQVKPQGACSYVTVYNATDTSTALPEKEGRFKVRGLKAGTYTVLYKGANGYKDLIVNSVEVTIGKELVLSPAVLVQ